MPTAAIFQVLYTWMCFVLINWEVFFTKWFFQVFANLWEDAVVVQTEKWALIPLSQSPLGFIGS